MSTHEEFPTRTPASTPAENRSISSLLSDLTQEVTTLMRQELQLAKAELSEKVSQVETGIGALAVGAALAFGGFIILLHAGIYGIADLLSETFNVPQLWIASLIVGGGFLIIGLAVLAMGQSKLKAKNLKPRRTARSLRQDEDFAREEVYGKRSSYDETY